MQAVRLLLEACADKNWADTDGRSPMYAASYNGHVDIVRLLLEAKADKDKACSNGKSLMLGCC